jgi:hypothetical protein
MIVARSLEADVPRCLACEAPPPAGHELRQAAAQDQMLHEWGWYSWRSEHEALLSCLCPECLSHPDRVAKSIVERHGLAPMVEWLRHWQKAN